MHDDVLENRCLMVWFDLTVTSTISSSIVAIDIGSCGTIIPDHIVLSTHYSSGFREKLGGYSPPPCNLKDYRRVHVVIIAL